MSGYNSNTSAHSAYKNHYQSPTHYSSLNSSPRQQQSFQFLSSSVLQQQTGSSFELGSPLKLKETENTVPKAIHLIYFDQDTKQFKVSEEAREFLSSIKERVGVISVAGKYRTGKSFLLNRVIINRRNMGFGVGPTINPCTKGLWLWGDTLEGEYQGEKLKVLLIDSEGIGAFDEDDNHDSKIFLLALLLSSYFIYNSMGTIDENAINSLSLIINLSKELQIKSEVLAGESDPDEISKFFPSFLWVVRDFSLRLLDNFGNPITQREYFENAIQQQKGTSDQIETKNRIRRLIKHFFKDRDCFTMVRPVEEERELQSLQTMPDDQLRSEFVTQVNQLRTKIYKKVKPKTLNSKQITGEMLLELCYAYTNAINNGSVPNIQNAWSYVCQNECQRATQESISLYEKDIRTALGEAIEKSDDEVIRKVHRQSREVVVAVFKQKAVGQDMQDYESQLREGISKKYKEIKNEFFRSCKSKAFEYLESNSLNIKKNLQNDMYDSLDKVRSDLEVLKNSYLEHGPKFHGRMEILLEYQLTILNKAADFLSINNRKETDHNVKRLQDRLAELQQERMSEKLEARHDKDVLTEKYIQLEAKFNETIRNEKLLSERFKSIQSEKERQELEFQEKSKKAQHELHSLVSGFESRVRTLESQLKVREEESFKKSNEHMKLQALIEQKLQLTEKELYECKAKYNLKDQDYKEANKELYQVKKVILSQVQKVEQDKHDELRALKEEHEVVVKEFQRQINAGITGNPQVSEDLQQQWNKERQQLNDQLKSLSEGLVAQKQFQEHLMKMLQTPKEQLTAVGTPEQYKNKIDKQKKKNADLQGMNQSLTQQIVQMQSKQQQLEKLVSTMKQYKYLLHQAIAIQCKSCNKLYPKNQYQEHIPECNREIERVSTLNAQQTISPIQVQIQTCLLKDNFISYELNIEKCLQCWRISKKLEAFKTFFDELYLQFPTYSHIIPFIQDEWLDLDKMGKEFYQSELKQILQKLMNDLVSVPFIRENVIFKQFLEFEGNYLDDSNFDKRRTIIQNNFSGGSILYGNITSQAGRQSVLNPFNIANPSNSGLKQAAVGDGKRSVSPLSGSQMLYAQNKINESAQRTYSRYSQMPYSTAQMIQELADDEDYSSLASKSRVSMPNGDESNRVSTVSQRLVTYNSREPTVAEYVPYYSQNVEKADDEEFGGVPLVEVLLDTVQNTGTIQSDTFTEVFRSNPHFPRPQRVHEIDDDSFSENLEGVTLSPRRMSSQLENPMLDGSPNGTDLQHTKTNLINKFDQEQKQTEGLSAHQNFAPSSTLSSARKQLNSRYEAIERSEEL